MQRLWQDLRYGVRMLKKNPGFTAVAVLTLALGIGANAVVFSVLNALILHPLHVPHAESLYGIQHGSEASSYQSYPDYLDLRDRNRSFDGLAAYNIDQAGLDTGENPTRIWVEEVSGNYFDVLSIQPYLGRVFHGSDEHGPDSAPYIVLTYAYWHTRFQDDRGVLGRVVQLNKHPFTIVGVAGPEFHGTLVFFNPDLFVPIATSRPGRVSFGLRSPVTMRPLYGLPFIKPPSSGLTEAARTFIRTSLSLGTGFSRSLIGTTSGGPYLV